MSAASGAGASCCTMLRRGLVALLVLFVVGGVAAWFGREWLLQKSADLWVVSDEVGRADAAAVFGGGLEDRPFAVADYYRNGLVKKIALSNIGPDPAERLGAVVSHVAANRDVLLKLGVPEDAIEIFGANLSNTYEEAVALREWAERSGVRSIIVPTEIFSARRVRWMLHRVFGDTAIIEVPAIEPVGYRGANWWKKERGLIAFQNEVIKYVFYRINY